MVSCRLMSDVLRTRIHPHGWLVVPAILIVLFCAAGAQHADPTSIADVESVRQRAKGYLAAGEYDLAADAFRKAAVLAATADFATEDARAGFRSEAMRSTAACLTKLLPAREADAVLAYQQWAAAFPEHKYEAQLRIGRVHLAAAQRTPLREPGDLMLSTANTAARRAARQAAATELEQLVSDDWTPPDVRAEAALHWGAACVELARGEQDRLAALRVASDQLKRALSFAPPESLAASGLNLMLGEVLSEMDQHQEACEWLAKALTGPASQYTAEAARLLADTERTAGNFGAAVDRYAGVLASYTKANTLRHTLPFAAWGKAACLDSLPDTRADVRDAAWVETARLAKGNERCQSLYALAINALKAHGGMEYSLDEARSFLETAVGRGFGPNNCQAVEGCDSPTGTCQQFAQCKTYETVGHCQGFTGVPGITIPVVAPCTITVCSYDPRKCHKVRYTQCLLSQYPYFDDGCAARSWQPVICRYCNLLFADSGCGTPVHCNICNTWFNGMTGHEQKVCCESTSNAQGTTINPWGDYVATPCGGGS